MAVALATAMFLLLLVASSAAAATEPVLIGEAGEGTGQYLNPRAVAVDQASGNVFLADGNNQRTDKFGSSGNFLLTWGRGVADRDLSTFETCGPEATPVTLQCFPSAFSPDGNGPRGNGQSLAVDQATGDVFSLEEHARVEKYTEDGEFLLMFGKDVDVTPGTPHPNLCTAADLAAGDTCANGTEVDEAGAIYHAESLATAPDGKVWISSDERILIFNSDGSFDRELALAGQGQLGAIAVDSNGDVFVTASWSKDLVDPPAFDGVRKFDGVTGTLLESFDESGDARTLAVDSTGNLYVGDNSGSYHFMVFNPSGEQTSQFGTGQVIGEPGGSGFAKANAIALDEANGFLYAASTNPDGPQALQQFSLPEPGPLPLNERAEDVLPTTATLAATVNPEGHATTYHFEYGTSTSYGTSSPSTPVSGSAFDDEPVSAAIDHLQPSTTYHFRIVASNHCNTADPSEVCTAEGGDQTFTTPAAVVVERQSSTHVTSNSVTLNADINPLGAPATWWLEYGTAQTYGSKTAEKQLPGSLDPISVTTGLLALQSGTTYHYRFVVRDERDGTVYVVPGSDQTFTTQLSSLDFRLSDGRAWELVTPAAKFGASVVNPVQGVLQASADGNRFAYQTTQSVEANPAGNRSLDYAHALAQRNEGSWSSVDITPPFTEVRSVPFGGEYKVFSRDLSRAVLEARDATPHSPEASERTPYVRENLTDPVRFRPLVTSKEPYANVPPGTVFGETGNSVGVPWLSIVGASSDLHHVLISSLPALVKGMPTSVPRGNGLYLWSDGRLDLVSRMPQIEGGEPEYGVAIRGSVRHVVSEDGSRVFWTNNPSPEAPHPEQHLYVRDIPSGQTARVDAVQPGASGSKDIAADPPGVHFQGASADGRIVFFTTNEQLTPDANPKGTDLYRCVFPAGEVGSACTDLTDLTSADGSGSAQVQVIAPSISEDGSAISFVARGVLSSTANGHGETAKLDGYNLYRWQEGEGVSFIAGLSSQDFRDWGREDLGGGNFGTDVLTAAGSPDGRYLAFMSDRSLTGYDNRDAATGDPLPEIFRYDAVEDDLRCVSCNPTGGRPIGEVSGEKDTYVRDPRSVWGGTLITALMPYGRATEAFSGAELYEARRVLDNGRVFFNALDALVPGDSNGDWDVYQYENSGVGDCTDDPTGAAVARSAGGCVSLLSSGSGNEEAGFLDASESGNDVFILTSSKLSVLDQDDEYDIYDARVGGVTASLKPRVECRGESCQPAVSPPNDPTPASSSFRGAGNSKERSSKKHCGKGKRRVTRHGKARCVKRKGRPQRHRGHHARRAGR